MKRKRKGRRSKAKNQKAHAKTRFKGRFDIDLNDNQYTQLCNMIHKGKGKFVEKKSNRVKIYDIKWEGKDIRVVYDKKRHNIVTALYRDKEMYNGSTDI